LYDKLEIKKDALHVIAKRHGPIKNPKRRGRRSHKPRRRLAREGMMIQFERIGEIRTTLDIQEL
jgi:hypothetical protein